MLFSNCIDDVRDVLIDVNICVAVADVCVSIGAAGYRCDNVPFNGGFSGSFVSGQMTDVEANGCAARGYCCSRFKVVLAFALAAAAVSDGEIDVSGSDFKFDFLPPALRLALLRQFYWPLSLARTLCGIRAFAQFLRNLSDWEMTGVGLSDSFLTFD